MEEQRLPALPNSDPESIARNQYHGHYKTGARDFWANASVSHTKIEDWKVCTHMFKREGYEIVCKKCHLGWLAPHAIEVQDGKLFLHSQQIQF